MLFSPRNLSPPRGECVRLAGEIINHDFFLALPRQCLSRPPSPSAVRRGQTHCTAYRGDCFLRWRIDQRGGRRSDGVHWPLWPNGAFPTVTGKRFKRVTLHFASPRLRVSLPADQFHVLGPRRLSPPPGTPSKPRPKNARDRLTWVLFMCCCTRLGQQDLFMYFFPSLASLPFHSCPLGATGSCRPRRVRDGQPSFIRLLPRSQ